MNWPSMQPQLQNHVGASNAVATVSNHSRYPVTKFQNQMAAFDQFMHSKLQQYQNPDNFAEFDQFQQLLNQTGLAAPVPTYPSIRYPTPFSASTTPGLTSAPTSASTTPSLTPTFNNFVPSFGSGTPSAEYSFSNPGYLQGPSDAINYHNGDIYPQQHYSASHQSAAHSILSSYNFDFHYPPPSQYQPVSDYVQEPMGAAEIQQDVQRSSEEDMASLFGNENAVEEFALPNGLQSLALPRPTNVNSIYNGNEREEDFLSANFASLIPAHPPAQVASATVLSLPLMEDYDNELLDAYNSLNSPVSGAAPIAVSSRDTYVPKKGKAKASVQPEEFHSQFQEPTYMSAQDPIVSYPASSSYLGKRFYSDLVGGYGDSSFSFPSSDDGLQMTLPKRQKVLVGSSGYAPSSGDGLQMPISERQKLASPPKATSVIVCRLPPLDSQATGICGFPITHSTPLQVRQHFELHKAAINPPGCRTKSRGARKVV
ncbi:hypothetical protein BT96DRAFT_1102680 [Gymnopus androsaceus JB14]|uniref:Uncharacterized protein n=1 Tax=Gymnopus androsaceus JB14 TaxID=1447944 RepID=A0A6A4HP08_9AGAR|nr:hypothetical protein BT96DRAFT_1102680 [Gymnopus androsaceus JB14]